MDNKKFKVYRAGAGSGKTFQLIKEILSLALSQPNHDYYRHILAITFTNAAAHEMRHRFLDALTLFAQTPMAELEANPLFQQVQLQSQLSPAELKLRAAATYRHVLHHYDLLSIGTIDSFAQRLVRSFSFELNIASDFGLELDTAEFYDRVVSACLDQVGIDPEITAYLKQVLLEQMDDESDWKTKQLLTSYATELANERAAKAVDSLLEYPDTFFHEAKRTARTIEDGLIKERTELAKAIVARLSPYSNDVEDYPYKGKGYFNKLQQLAAGDNISSYGRLSGVAESGEFFGKKPKISVNSADAEWLQTTLQLLMDYISGEKGVQIQLYRTISSKILILGLLKVLARVSRTVREEERILLIGDLHKRVNDVLIDQSSPFLYERLGVRYKHILIDEFQDTSQVQWSNMLPLFANSLSENLDTMVVGDAKQSIYRFRGGKVRQFVDLPEVPEDHMSPQETSIFRTSFAQTILNTNRRSDATVVQFNNALYKSWSMQLPGLNQVYDDVAQESVKEGAGWVTAQRIENDQLVDSTVSLVKDQLKHNFLPGEIAILVLKKKVGYQITERLMAEGIRVQSEESLLLCNSPHVSFIDAWLNHLERPGNQEAALSLVAHMSRIHSTLTVADFSEYMHTNELNFAQAMEKVIKPEWPELFDHQQEDIYNEATRVIAICKWEIDVFLEFFLNVLFQKSRKENLSRHKWNEWWKKRRLKASIKASADLSAVRMMTVHKSKGLEYPCVIFCCLSSNPMAQSEWFALPPNQTGVEALAMNITRKPKGDPDQWLMEDPILERQNTQFVQEMALEDLNVRYVATTRAKEVLHLLVGQKSLDAQMWNSIEEVPDKLIVNDRLEWGNPVVLKARELEAEYSATGLIMGKLQVDTPLPQESTKSDFQRWGDFVHKCLAYIKTNKDIDSAVEKVYRTHLHRQWMSMDELKTKLTSLLEDEEVTNWYLPNLEVWLERDLFLADGKVLRPDRVVRNGAGIAVIDYKTGKPTQEHHAQVQLYMETLSQLYMPQEVVGYLWYLDGNHKIQVSNK